jgi:hypothetical protein
MQADQATAYEVSLEVPIPVNVFKGDYLAGVGIVEERTGIPINLAFGGRDQNGIHILSNIEITR